MRLKTTRTWVTKAGKRRRIRRYMRWEQERKLGKTSLSYEEWCLTDEWRNRTTPGTRRQKVHLTSYRSRKTGKRRIIRLYNVWTQMKFRTSTDKEQFKYWYGKKVYWDTFEEFREWAIANGYGKDLTIDRIDSSKGYHPDNCEWVTREENCRRAGCL